MHDHKLGPQKQNFANPVGLMILAIDAAFRVVCFQGRVYRNSANSEGSPLNALKVEPPFEEHHWIDLDESKVAALKRQTAGLKHVHIYGGDANKILLNEVFPKIRFENFERALCILDPYGLHLNWEVIETAAKMGTIEIFLNFPVLDMNRNVLLWEPTNASADDVKRMTALWKDES